MSIYKKLFEVKKTWIKIQRDTKAYNYKYATLDQIQSKLNPAFQEQGLVVIHQIQDNKVVTKIVDTEDDSFIFSEIELTTSKAQEIWSEITYYRRYNLLSLLDLEVEDDDWEKAQWSKLEDDKPWIDEKKIKAIAEYILKWNEVKISKDSKKTLEEIGVK